MPYRAPGTDDERLRWILREIQKSQQTLDESIAAAERLPDSNLTKTERLARYRTLKREVDNSFSGLDKSVGTWATRDVPSFYQSGWFVGATQTPGARFDFTLPHREALDLISYDAYDDVATRLQKVRQGFTDTVDLQELYEGLSQQDILEIQKRSRSAVTQSLLTGEADPKKVARSLTHDLWNNNSNLKIIDAGGKQWQMQTYTRMLVRTKSANAYNSGSLNKYAEENVQRVQVFDGVEDEVCAKANGEIWSLRYAMQNVIAHPNCVRAFAPVQGTGEVNEDTENATLVAFDRAELGIASIVALRHFRESGEINVSATLARLVWEVAEAYTFPMPILDGLVTGLAYQGIRSVDAWVESFIDPVLYHAGLIKNIPPRAQIQRARRPQTVIDAVANTVKAAAQEAFGTDQYPQAAAILDRLEIASLSIDATFRAARLATRKDGWRYLDVLVTDILDTNRLGQITAETLLRLRDGDTTVRDAVQASVFTLDQFREVRRLHLELLTSTLDQTLEIYDELDRIGLVAAELLAGRMAVDEAPDFFIEALQRWALTRVDLQDATQADRRLAELLNNIQTAKQDASNRIADLMHMHSRRALAYPDELPTPWQTTSLWDDDALDLTTDIFEKSLADAAVTMQHQQPLKWEAFDDLRKNLTAVVTSDEPPTWLWKYVDNDAAFEAAVHLDDAATEFLIRVGLGNAHASFKNPQDVLESLVRLLNLVKRRADGTLHPSSFGREFPPSVLEYMRTLSRTIDDKAWEFDEGIPMWKFVFGLDNRPFLEKHLVGDSNPALLFRETIDKLTGPDVADQSHVTLFNLEVWLESLWKGTHRVGDMGANGASWVSDISGIPTMIKPMRASGHTGARSSGVLSEVLTSYLADRLGVSGVVPVRVATLADSDPQAVLVMPYIENLQRYEVAKQGGERGNLRDLSLFDMLTIERDGHYGNYGTIDSGGLPVMISFDNEAGWDLIYPFSKRAQPARPSTAGAVVSDFRGYQLEQMSKSVIEPDGQYRFYKLTADEADHTYGGGALGTQTTGEIIAGYSRLTQFSYAEMPTISGVLDVKTGVQDLHHPIGMAMRVDGNIDSFDIPYRLKGLEAEWVDQIINDTDAAAEDILSALHDALDGTGTAFKTELVDSWYRQTDSFDEALEDISETVAEMMSVRYQSFMDNGRVITKSGDYVSPRGTTFHEGDVMSLYNEAGETLDGVVSIIWEDSRGRRVAGVWENLGMGYTRKQLDEAFSVEYRMIVLDEWEDAANPTTRTLNQRVAKTQDSMQGIPAPWEGTEDPWHTLTPVSDELGLHLGFEEKFIEVEFDTHRTDVLSFADSQGKTVDLTASGVWTHGHLNTELSEMLSKVAPEHRPSKVVVHGTALETPEGLPAFGFVDPATNELHISVAPLLDEFEVRKWEGKTHMVVDDIHDIASGLNRERLLEVLVHELGHSIEVRQDALIRQQIIGDLMENLLIKHPDVSDRATLASAIVDELPEVGGLLDDADPLEALLRYQADIIEDIVNTNKVEEAKALLANRDGLPTWALRAYQDILNGSAEAQEELYAEIWARVLFRVDVDPDDAIRDIAQELGVDKYSLRSYLSRSAPVGPPNFDLTSAGFQRWLSQTLNPGASKIVPKERSSVAALWKRFELDTDALAARVLDPDTGEGGFTINLLGEDIEGGIPVALKRYEEVYNNVDKDEFKVRVREFHKKHAKLISEHADLEIGAWRSADGTVYLDVVRIHDDPVEAAMFGFAETQEAAFNLNTFEEIPLLNKYPDFESWLAGEYPKVRLEDYLSKQGRMSVAVGKTGRMKLIDVVDVEGKAAPISMSLFNEVETKRLLDALDTYSMPISNEIAKDNYIRVLERAAQEYAKDPSLRAKHRFYEIWNEQLTRAALDNNVSNSRLIAAAAAMSPGYIAEKNLLAAIRYAELVGDNSGLGHRLSRKEAEAVRHYLEREAERSIKEFNNPERASQFRGWAAQIRGGRYLNSYDEQVGARIIHELMMRESGGTLGLTTRYGFRHFEKALAVLQSRMTASEALGDTKVRSFYNNIVDPFNRSGVGDVTIDFHMADMAFFAKGAGGKPGIKADQPKIWGIAAGLRPILGDTVRELFDEGWGEIVGAESPAQLQEILWEIWRQGKADGWWGELPTVKRL